MLLFFHKAVYSKLLRTVGSIFTDPFAMGTYRLELFRTDFRRFFKTDGGLVRSRIKANINLNFLVCRTYEV